MSWDVPQGVVDLTIGWLSGRAAEAFALWTAPIAGGRVGCEASRAAIPRQEAHGGGRWRLWGAGGPEARVGVV